MKFDNPKIFKLIEERADFIWMLLGAGAAYATNIVFAHSLSSASFVVFSTILTFSMWASTFSLLGSDQLVIRNSRVSDGNIHIPEGYEKIYFHTSILFAVVSFFIFLWIFGFFCSALISAVSFIFSRQIIDFTSHRLTGNYAAAQIEKNLWRICLLAISCFVFIIGKDVGDSEIFLFFFFSVLAAKLCSRIFFRPVNLIKDNGPADLSLWWPFFVSMLLMNAMTHGDRFVASIMGNDYAAEYLLLQTVILFPVSIFQNYFGIRDAVSFKAHTDIKKINIKLAKSAAIGGLVSASLVLIYFLSESFHLLPRYADLGLGLVCVFGITGFFRICYSSLSAAMSVSGDKFSVRVGNYGTLIPAAVIASSFFYVDLTPFSLSFAFLLVWISRFFSFYLGLYVKYKS